MNDWTTAYRRVWGSNSYYRGFIKKHGMKPGGPAKRIKPFDHLQKAVVLKGQLTLADEALIPVLKRINRLPGVKTLYSCVGDHINQPMIMVVFQSLETTQRFMKRVEPYKAIRFRQIDADHQTRLPRFILCSRDSHDLMGFMQ